MLHSIRFPLLIGLTAAAGLVVWQPWNPVTEVSTHESPGITVPPRAASNTRTQSTGRLRPDPAAPTQETAAEAPPAPSQRDAASTAPGSGPSVTSNEETMTALVKAGLIDADNGTFIGGSPRVDITSGDADAFEMPPAIRLSEDFKLPAVFLALDVPVSKGGLAGKPKPVVAAAQAIVDNFYRDIARQVGKTASWHDDLETNPDTEESTYVVKPGADFEPIRRAADEKFRLLFGNDAYNAYMVRSGTERMLDSASN